MKQKTFLDYLYYKLIRFNFFYKITAKIKLLKQAKQNSSNFSLKYKIEDLNKAFYEKIRHGKNTELEHQIGRLTNFKEIIKDCSKLNGDILEFGTWKGFSLLWIAYLLEREAIFDRKIIGIDGFIGLPEDDGPFKKGAFSDTSLAECRHNLIDNPILYEETCKNIFIEKFLFKQKKEILSFFSQIGTQKFCFIHIDSDIGQSTREIFSIIQDENMISDKAYLLFDDYGWDTRLAPAVESIFEKMNANWKISVHSSTRYTKNFLLERR